MHDLGVSAARFRAVPRTRAYDDSEWATPTLPPFSATCPNSILRFEFTFTDVVFNGFQYDMRMICRAWPIYDYMEYMLPGHVYTRGTWGHSGARQGFYPIGFDGTYLSL